MKPLLFGPGDRPLYGVYHAPVAGKPPRAAVILNPWGWEALRAHRTLATLASFLAATGCAVLRFDYAGTGDSWGDTPTSPDDWLDDAEWAVDELMALSGQRRIGLVGLRLGALAAVQVLRRRPRDIERLVCWEPPPDGATFLEWMSEAPRHEAVAFPVPGPFRTGVRDWTLDALASFRGDLFVLDAEPGRFGADEARSVQAVTTSGHPRCWVEDLHHGAGRVPTELITAIVRGLSA